MHSGKPVNIQRHLQVVAVRDTTINQKKKKCWYSLRRNQNKDQNLHLKI